MQEDVERPRGDDVCRITQTGGTDRDSRIERSSTKTVHSYSLLLVSPEAISQAGRCRLIDDT